MLLILDGIGYNKETHGNAVALAKAPMLNTLLKEYPHSLLQSSGLAVGLPQGQMGNSEVGHLNIGAGRVVFTGLSLINKDIKEGNYFKNKAFLVAKDHVIKNDSKLHIIALISNGGVHSSFEHIMGLVDFAIMNKIPTVLHCISDGRDVDPHSFAEDIEIITKKIAKEKNIKLGMIAGRYYAMDRDQRWDRIEIAFKSLVGKGFDFYHDPIKYVNSEYKSNNTDEFIKPAMNDRFDINELKLSDNDAVIFGNFRPDRAREMSHMIFGSNYYDYKPSTVLKNIFLVTLMKYEGIEPSMIAYPPIILENVLGKVLEDNNISQLRIAETEKYAHVTFFFDGGEEINYKNEKKILVPSPKVATYDLQPEMSADILTEKILENMDNFEVIIVNYANGDMVGHTGFLDKTIQAVECVDKNLRKIFDQAQKTNTTLFITADHGNADVMLDEKNNPVTKHSMSPVFFISTDRKLNLKDGSLGNIAPTILKYIGIEIPKEMTEKPLY